MHFKNFTKNSSGVFNNFKYTIKHLNQIYEKTFECFKEFFIKKAYANPSEQMNEELLALYNQGLLLIKSGDLQKALINFNKLLKLNPKFPNAAAIRNKIIEKIDASEPQPNEPDSINNAEVYFNEGNALFELGLFAEALEAYQKSIDINDKNPILWYYKANSLLKLNKLEEALEAYDRVIDINPNFADAWHGKSSCLIRLQRTDEALACFDKILEIDPDHAPFTK